MSEAADVTMDEPDALKKETVGVVLVHGIGEQRRFEHLDGQLRFLIESLQGLRARGAVKSVSVDILPANAAAFQAEQDSWAAGPHPSAEVVVRHDIGGTLRETRLFVHEVWWADVNEPYSIAKQVRFWLWGLSVWAHPGKSESTRPTVGQVEPLPVRPIQSVWARAQLLLIATFFVLVGYSIGTLTFLLTRLFQLNPPRLLIVLTNYVSSVKLYNQQQRRNASVPGQRDDFLDTIGEPPRVSIRRRMIRTIADVANNNYDRWYVLAHSQGSVVAYNGLMETSYAWPGYLDRGRWMELGKNGFVKGAPEKSLKHFLAKAHAGNVTMPRRPGWVDDAAEIDRSKIFAKFRGFLTYGSPLAKFAFIWPSLVPMSTEPAFPVASRWFNLYDPIDPVSGVLEDFGVQAEQLNGHTPEKLCCPPPVDLGYNAGWILLLTHLKYLTRRTARRDAATATLRWMLSDSENAFEHLQFGWRTGTWFHIKSRNKAFRRTVAYSSWLAVAVALLWLGAAVLPTLVQAVGSLIASSWTLLKSHAPNVPHAIAVPVDWLFAVLGHWAFSILLVAARLGDMLIGTTNRLLAHLGVSPLSGNWQVALLLFALACIAPIVIGIVAIVPAVIQRWAHFYFGSRLVVPVGYQLDADDARLQQRQRERVPPPKQPGPTPTQGSG